MKFLPPLLAALGLFASICTAIEPDELAKRQCRSVHMNFGPMPEQCQAIYMEATVEKVSPGTYFCAMNFDDGYIGFQELADGKHIVIFSIWDPVAHGDIAEDVPLEDRVELMQTGTGVTPDRFSHEGTGGKSMGPLDWKTGQKIKFLVTVRPSLREGYKVISGYVNLNGKWDLISSWRTHRSAKELSRATSFVEDFRRNYESAKHARSAVFGPCFVMTREGEWKWMNHGRFTADPTPSDHVLAEAIPAQHAFRIATGGDTAMGSFKLWDTQNLPENAAPTPPGDDVKAVIDNPVKEKPVPAAAK